MVHVWRVTFGQPFGRYARRECHEAPYLRSTALEDTGLASPGTTKSPPWAGRVTSAGCRVPVAVAMAVAARSRSSSVLQSLKVQVSMVAAWEGVWTERACPWDIRNVIKSRATKIWCRGRGRGGGRKGEGLPTAGMDRTLSALICD